MQNQKKIKMLVTDIDGTILNNQNICSPRMRATINALKERDVKVVLATGRMYAGAKPVAKDIGLDTPIICYQGAMVKLDDEVLWQAPVKNEVAREIIDILHGKNIHTNLYNNDFLITEEHRYMDVYCRGRFVTYEVVKDLNDVVLGNVSKLLAIIEDENELYALQKELLERYEGVLAVVRSHKHYLEITDVNATKGNALRFVAGHFGFSKDEVAASGDQDNDFEMLKAAGIGIAMGDASPKLKEIAHFVCPSVDEDGLCVALERYIF